MPRSWTARENVKKYEELLQLYCHESKTIFEIGKILNIHYVTVYQRLIRFNIPIRGSEKSCHNARILLVPPHSGDLAEFCGIMLGDGHVGLAQLFVTVNVKTDSSYIQYLQNLIEGLFNFRPRVIRFRGVCVDLCITSKHLMRELRTIGLYSPNKVRDQVVIPHWIFQSTEYQRRFVRGFFDTDGSIYQLKWFNAVQMSFKNRSFPLLEGTREILLSCGYRPSRISNYSVYLTRRQDVRRYIQEIGFGNDKHRLRARSFGIP